MTKALTYDDVLLVPAYNHYESRRDVDISNTDQSGKLSLPLPLMTSNMDTITEYGMANFIGAKGGIGVLHRFMSIDENVEQFKKCKYPVFVSVGCNAQDQERAMALKDAGATHFCVDVAHAHARNVGRILKQLRHEIVGLENCIMAGNVATYAGADYLASCGADIIKVGIGGGSVCTTRIKTGFGVPNLTAIKECSKVSRSIVADGGIRNPGDIVKALSFGADFVMIGSMLAGTHPTPGPVNTIKEENGQEIKYKSYRGMASREVQEDYHGGVAEWKTAEGIATKVPYKDNEEAIIADIIGGLRSGLCYAGSLTLRELQRKLNYVEITQSGIIENTPHKLTSM